MSSFCWSLQRVVGGAHVGELGLAVAARARPRHAMRVEHRQRRRDAAERAVGMPQPVAELVEAARVVAPAHLVLGVEVGDVGDLGPQPALDVGGAAARQFELAEIARERHLAFVVEVLAAEHQHRVAIDRRIERRDRRGVDRLADIEPRHLGGEQRMQLADR